MSDRPNPCLIRATHVRPARSSTEPAVEADSVEERQIDPTELEDLYTCPAEQTRIGEQRALVHCAALKAVVSVYSTDDRYADDAHYMGGCLLIEEMLGWGTTMHTVATLPPDPKSVGPRWKPMWQERLAAFHPEVHTWLTHQRQDAYWAHGSVWEDYSAITCAVYVVGGWCDGYRDSVFRLLQGLFCPRKGLIGPWSHHYAMFPFEPGPHIGFLQECIRYFDEWLKGEETGIMDEPMLRVWI